MPLDLVIRRAQLRQRAGLVDIGIADGAITAVDARLDAPARDEIDAAGRLVTEPFVDCHFHIDKSFTGAMLNRFVYPLTSLPDLDNVEGTPVARHRVLKRSYTVENVAERIERALALALLHGTLAVRMFVDVDPVQGLTAVRAALRARERFGDRMTLQVCAFPQEGLLTHADTLTLMDQALALGADVVGGIPWIEPDEASAQAHVDRCFALARRYDRDVHLLCDDTPHPASRTLEMVAAATIREGYQGRVAASHNGALRFYSDERAARVIGLVRDAGIHVVVIPHLSLLGTLTRVEELLASGVNVCSGQDDLDNFFYPLGWADMLDAVYLMVHVARLATPEGFEVAFDVGTRNGARALHLRAYGLRLGMAADLVIFDARNLQEVLQRRAVRAYVIARGRVAATTTRQSQASLPEGVQWGTFEDVVPSHQADHTSVTGGGI